MLLPTINYTQLQELEYEGSLNYLTLFNETLIELPINIDNDLSTKILAKLPTLKNRPRLSLSLSIIYLDLALNLLDFGFKKIYFSVDDTNLQDVVQHKQSFDKARFGLILNYEEVKPVLSEFLAEIKEYVSSVAFSSSTTNQDLVVDEILKVLNESNYKGDKLLNLLQLPPNPNQIQHLVKHNLRTIVSTQFLTLEEVNKSTNVEDKGVNLVDALLATITTDRADGLYTTCVVDSMGTLLGLCYSSAESIRASIRSKKGYYHSRKRGLWLKGESSGNTQDLLKIDFDCDNDTLRYTVNQAGKGFCHNDTLTCFGNGMGNGIVELERTINSRKVSAPEGSYTHRLFTDPDLLTSKLMEEAGELCQAETKDEVAWEAADLLYFALVKCASVGVTLSDIQANLELKALKVTRRPGDAKPHANTHSNISVPVSYKHVESPPPVPSSFQIPPITPATQATVPPTPELYEVQTFNLNEISENERQSLLKRPILAAKEITGRVEPIINEVKHRGDAAVLEFTAKFDGVELETSTLVAPFNPEHMVLEDKVKAAIDQAYENIYKFHAAQVEKELEVEVMPGVTCTRFHRPIQSVGLYVPGGSAVLPSTALMLGIPAAVAGCKQIVIATPPRKDGTIAPEVLYVAHKVGATHLVMAGGAQAIAAMAYGTETVPKVDKLCGPGNQYVTCAKMLLQNEVSAMVSIDMPAGPSEVLVVADVSSNPEFVASDLLSQAEHGPDSQSVLVTVNLSPTQLLLIDKAIYRQASKLPRKDIVAQSLKHSFHVQATDMEQAIQFANDYASEHLILQVNDPHSLLPAIQHAGSVFLGHYSPESCGDYASGTNHTLPTYGYARMYGGVSLSTFLKPITSQYLTKEGLQLLGPTVIQLAEVETLGAHANAVKVRLGL